MEHRLSAPLCRPHPPTHPPVGTSFTKSFSMNGYTPPSSDRIRFHFNAALTDLDLAGRRVVFSLTQPPSTNTTTKVRAWAQKRRYDWKGRLPCVLGKGVYRRTASHFTPTLPTHLIISSSSSPPPCCPHWT
mgnify:CR=1 FL=1